MWCQINIQIYAQFIQFKMKIYVYWGVNVKDDGDVKCLWIWNAKKNFMSYIIYNNKISSYKLHKAKNDDAHQKMF
jgi:hypothetical protein